MTGGDQFGGYKPAAIVANVQFQPFRRLTQVDFYLAGFGMFGNVVQRFLADAVEGDLRFGGQAAFTD